MIVQFKVSFNSPRAKNTCTRIQNSWAIVDAPLYPISDDANLMEPQIN